MKVIIYQPFRNLSLTGMERMIHLFNEEVIIEALFDFPTLLDKVKTGKYVAVLARRPEHYMIDVLHYYELMECAIGTGTKIYETTGFNELTSSFMSEAAKPLNATQMKSIYLHIKNKI